MRARARVRVRVRVSYLLAMTPSTLAALLAEASSAATIVATTFTLAAVTLRYMSSGATSAALARPAMKLAWLGLGLGLGL